jgi:hypothetical protein
MIISGFSVSLAEATDIKRALKPFATGLEEATNLGCIKLSVSAAGCKL